MPRLALSGNVEPIPFTYDEYADIVNQSCLDGHVFFLDTCFVTGHEVSDQLWDAFLGKKLVFPKIIQTELEPWAANPRKNLRFHDAYVKAVSHGHPAFDFTSFEVGSDEWRGIVHYVLLLGLRKQVYDLVSKISPGLSEVALQQEVQKLVQDRGMTLAKKGLLDRDKVNFLADEVLIVRAFEYALRTGNDVTVLTRDRDIREQFFKFQYIFDTHYRSMLLADAFRDQPLNFHHERSLGESDQHPQFLECELHLLPAGMDRKVLPGDFKWVNVHVDHIATKGSGLVYFSTRFCADREMLKLFGIKARTNGLNTESLGDKNFHRCVAPKLQEHLGTCIGVTKDRFLKAGDFRWTITDVELALSRCERSSSIETLSESDEHYADETVEQAYRIASTSLPNRLKAVYSYRVESPSVNAFALSLKLSPPWTRVLLDSRCLNRLSPRVIDSLNQVGFDTIGSGLRTPLPPGFQNVFDYYLAILIHRRLFGEICRLELRKELSFEPHIHQVKKRVKEYAGDAAWRRCSEFLDNCSDPQIFDDERLVVSAFLGAINSGRETTIITDRRVAIDQFFAMAHLIEGHYRAWAIASFGNLNLELLSLDRKAELPGFKTAPHCQKCDADWVDSVMPQDQCAVNVKCMLIDHESRSNIGIYPVGFPVEAPMYEMLKCKQRAALRSYDFVDGRSIHFHWNQNENREIFGQWWLGYDKKISVGTDLMPHPGIPLAVSEIPSFDLIQAVRLDRFAPFPWDEYARVKNLAKARSKLRKRKPK